MCKFLTFLADFGSFWSITLIWVICFGSKLPKFSRSLSTISSVCLKSLIFFIRICLFRLTCWVLSPCFIVISLFVGKIYHLYPPIMRLWFYLSLYVSIHSLKLTTLLFVRHFLIILTRSTYLICLRIMEISYPGPMHPENSSCTIILSGYKLWMPFPQNGNQ